jgi:phosphoesterase RecJ-like protein
MKKILDAVKKYDNFLLFGHEDPDADSICSQLVISFFLNSIGKTTHLYSQLPFTRPELLKYEHYFSCEINNSDITPNTALFIVDCNNISRIKPFSDIIASLPVIIIDHHYTKTIPQKSDSTSFIDNNAASTTCIVFNFLKKAGYKLNKLESDMLMLGLCTDTGFFRHLAENSGQAFKIAAKLSDLGTSPNNIYYEIYGSRTEKSIKFLSMMFSRLEFFFNGKLLILYEKISDANSFSKLENDKDTLYQILLGTKGLKIVAFFRENEEKKCSVSLRTREDIDLSEIASHFGGGGHKKASGYTTLCSLDEAIENFKKYVCTQFS